MGYNHKSFHIKETIYQLGTEEKTNNINTVKMENSTAHYHKQVTQKKKKGRKGELINLYSTKIHQR